MMVAVEWPGWWWLSSGCLAVVWQSSVQPVVVVVAWQWRLSCSGSGSGSKVAVVVEWHGG
jgi:hypothetical protein